MERRRANEVWGTLYLLFLGLGGGYMAFSYHCTFSGKYVCCVCVLKKQSYAETKKKHNPFPCSELERFERGQQAPCHQSHWGNERQMCILLVKIFPVDTNSLQELNNLIFESWLSIPYLGFPGGAEVKNPPAKAMAPHSSTLAWKIPWMEEPGGLQSMGSPRVGHD